MSVAARLCVAASSLLSRFGLGLIPTRPEPWESWRDRVGGTYRSDREVIRAARRAGQSVGDYREACFGKPGRVRRIIEQLQRHGALETCAAVCEIGAGTGHYVEQIRAVARPERYEIYETQRRRAAWLSRTQGVIARSADGRTLGETPDASVDLVHAHGVFDGLNPLYSYGYFAEMARVLRPGGYAAFDIVSESCLDERVLDEWLSLGLRSPRFLPRELVLAVFRGRGMLLAGEFRMPLLVHGESHYLVLRKAPRTEREK